jgi:hypothetical protein
MTIHALWVINKAGGLVFSRQYSGEWNAGEMSTLAGAEVVLIAPLQTFCRPCR